MSPPHRRERAGINTGSMADIAFLLLIFFLITTTMNPELGLLRKLPPESDGTAEVHERNVLLVWVNADNEIMVNGQLTNIEDLPEMALEFITNPENRDDMPDKELKDIPLLGTMPVSKQIISLQNDVRTSYGTYVEVQDALASAYREARNELAINEFGSSYEDLLKSGAQSKARAIKAVFPQRISEAEPNF